METLTERNRMLVLSRRQNEELCIDGSIRVVVLGIQGNRVRLGISAPDDVSIHRGEVEVRLEGDHDHDLQSSSKKMWLVQV